MHIPARGGGGTEGEICREEVKSTSEYLSIDIEKSAENYEKIFKQDGTLVKSESE
jgi:hypothetical protein